jgi:hypothetical protein
MLSHRLALTIEQMEMQGATLNGMELPEKSPIDTTLSFSSSFGRNISAGINEILMNGGELVCCLCLS